MPAVSFYIVIIEPLAVAGNRADKYFGGNTGQEVAGSIEDFLKRIDLFFVGYAMGITIGCFWSGNNQVRELFVGSGFN